MHDLRWPESEPHVTLIRRDCINRFFNWVTENFLESLLVVGICTEFCVMHLVLTLLSARNHEMMPDLVDNYMCEDACVIYYVLLGTTENLDLAPSLAHHNAFAQHIGLYFTASRGVQLVNGIR